jgi:hypothetical protein
VVLVSSSSSHLKARIVHAAKLEAAPTRATARRDTWLIVAAAVLFAAALFFWLGGVHIGDARTGIPERPLTFVCGTVIGWSAIAAVAMWMAFSRGKSMLGRRASVLLVVAIMTPAILFGWMLLWNAQYPQTMAVYVGRPGFKCLSFTLAMTGWPLVALSYVRRERNPVAPTASGAARGVAMGALAGIVVDLWCPIAGPAHVLVGHISPILLLMVLGAVVGKLLTGVRLRR